MRDVEFKIPRAFVPLLGNYRYKGAKGGRASAKSHFFASLLVEECLATKGTLASCMREVQVSLKQSVKRLVEAKIREAGVSDQFKLYNEVIQTPGDGIIVFQGIRDHTAESIKSLEGFRIGWFEEAQKMTAASSKLIRPTFRNKSQLWFSWNPYKPTDPVETLLVGPKKISNSVVVSVTYRDNPYFPEELRLEMEYDRDIDLDAYNHIWEGGYNVKSKARVFQNVKIEPCRARITPKTAHLFGADFGFSTDPNALLRCHLDGNTLYVTDEVYAYNVETDQLPAFYDCLVPEHPGFARSWPIVADSSEPATISYLKRHGYPRIMPSIKGAGSVEEGIKFLKSLTIVVDPSCVNVIREILDYNYVVDKRSGMVLPVLPDKENHALDCLRYALESTRRIKAGVR